MIMPKDYYINELYEHNSKVIGNLLNLNNSNVQKSINVDIESILAN
jgi:hypothetical protein